MPTLTRSCAAAWRPRWHRSEPPYNQPCTARVFVDARKQKPVGAV